MSQVTAAEQLAAALARIIEETIEKSLAAREAARRPEASLTAKEAGKILGYHPNTIRRLAVSGVLKSDGEGKARRYRVSYVEDFRRRLAAAGGRIWDLTDRRTRLT